MSFAGGLPVLVDARAGSGDLYPYLQQLGIPSRTQLLDYGDAEWVGRGPQGRPVPIVAEVKALGDLVQVFIDGRLTGTREDGSPGQLQGMVQRFEVVYLIVEGMRRLPDGRVLKHSHVTYDQIQGFLTSIEQGYPVTVVYTLSRSDTAAWIASKYRWWNGKEYEKHRSHLREHRMLDGTSPIEIIADPRLVRRRKVARDLADGMGATRASAAAEHFASVRAMVNADEREWQLVEGVGKKLATYIVEGVQ